jgi:hypothetical protein
LKLLDIGLERSATEVRLRGAVERAAGERVELFFAFPAELTDFVYESADAFVPALLVPSLKTGEDLTIVPPVSKQLLRRLPRIQDVLVSWHAPFRRVAVHARQRDDELRPAGTAVGALFSSGVDSFYTLLKSLRGWPSEIPPITHLVFLRGLETPLHLSRGVDRSQEQVEEIAREVGLGLLIGSSNVRTLFTLNYELYYHGAALVSAALALSGGLRHLLVPSSNAYAQLRPWGTDPLLDPLWSTERLEVVHDGSEARRVDKLERLVARDPLARKYLRVCLENSGGAYNCGRCRKCVRSMIALALLGVLGEFQTFPPELAPDAERLFRQDIEEVEKHAVELLDLASRTGLRPDVKRLVERVARRRRRRRAIRDILENTPLLDEILPLVDRARKQLRGVRASAGEPPPRVPAEGRERAG